MLFTPFNRIYIIITFLIISFLLFNVFPIISKRYVIRLQPDYKMKSAISIDPIMKDLGWLSWT